MPTALAGGGTVFSTAGGAASTAAFPIDGSFTLSLADGEIEGHYSGTAEFLGSDRWTASVVLHATGGTGRFSGASGCGGGGGCRIRGLGLNRFAVDGDSIVRDWSAIPR
jgi:hypothetical protein